MSRSPLLAGLAGAVFLTPVASAAPLSEPLRTPEGLVYPEGSAIPRLMTPVERAYVEEFPLRPSTRAATPPPAVRTDIRCPGEYEPMQGIIFAWEPWNSSITTILSSMVREVTTVGQARAFIMVDSASEQSSASSAVSGAGADMSRVDFFVSPTDTIWIRDYGPRYIYEGAVRSIVDHEYNRPRPNDNQQPIFWANQSRRPRYELPLVHGGGNYHLSGLGQSYSTRLIANENPALTEPEIIAAWRDYQNLETTLTQPFPSSVDSTQHIDMWMQITGDRSAMISDWPNNSGSAQDVICDQTAAALIAAGWTVARVPAFSVSGVHYTYTNVVMCNNLVLIPTYSSSTVAPFNASVLTAWQAHLPGKTFRQVNCQAIVTAAGVMHCIVMHVPAPLGGASPTVYLRSLRGPETLTPGALSEIRWSTDDDLAVTNVDILLSIDGGASFPTVIAAATPDDGSFTWTVPSIYSTTARVRVLARDADGNTGHASSSADLFINAPPPRCDGDANGDRSVAFGDVTAALASWGLSGAPYIAGDVTGDGVVNFADITRVLERYGTVCP